MLKWNVENNIFFMSEYEYSLDFANELLVEIGEYAKKHKIRLTIQQKILNNKLNVI